MLAVQYVKGVQFEDLREMLLLLLPSRMCHKDDVIYRRIAVFMVKLFICTCRPESKSDETVFTEKKSSEKR